MNNLFSGLAPHIQGLLEIKHGLCQGLWTGPR